LGHDDGPANDGQLCVRGRFGVVDVAHNSARLKTPLVRRGGRLVEVSWDEALKTAAQGLSKYQGDEVAVISSAAATNEESYVLQKFSRAVMHSNNVTIANDFPEHEGTDELVDTLRTIDSPTIRDVRDAASILVIGANVHESHPIVGLEILHALTRGAQLITFDVRQTNMTMRSNLWLQPKTGTDHFLLAAIIKLITELERTERCREFTDLDLTSVVSVTGVEEGDIVRAAHVLKGRRPIVIIYGSGVTHYPTALEAIRAIRKLAFTLGDTRIMQIPGEGNFVGAHDMGVHPALLPGYCKVSDPTTYEAKWKTTLNPNPGRNYEQILAGIRGGQIKALYLAGGLPPLPELAKLSFMVMQDIVSTENMQYAHVVFPSTTFVEMDGSLTNLEGRVQRLHQAIPPVGQSRPGWMITKDLAERIADVHWSYSSAEDVLVDVASTVPAYANADYKALNIPGILRRFQSTTKVDFTKFSLNSVPQIVSEEFPFTLITERNLFHYRGANLTKHVKGMHLIKENEILQLNSSDAARLGVADGATVKVETRDGSAHFNVQISDLPEGVAFTSINPIVGSPLFANLTPSTKACAVRVYKQTPASEEAK
jgi:predicted molibdopterin-dependent oxidoreductase YjgC